MLEYEISAKNQQIINNIFPRVHPHSAILAAELEQFGLSYQYQVLDFHHIDCETLFQQDTPEALRSK